MKGPGLRIDLDVRRVWRCSKCGRVVRTLGQVTALRCGCAEAAQWMHLEPAVKKEPFRAPPREHLPEEWEVAAAAESSAVQPADAEATVAIEQSPAGSAPQAPEPPPSEPAPVTVSEIPSAEIILAESVVVDESATEGRAPAVPPPDAFGTGVEDPQRNPD